MPGGLLQPAYPLNAGELARLLSALAAARKCGADAGAFSELPAEAQALLLRLDIKPRTGPEVEPPKYDMAADLKAAGIVGGVCAAPVVDPNRPRSAASF